MADNPRLVIMTFPQRWDPATATLAVNALVVPSVSPVDDPLVSNAPTFADHVPALRAVVIGSLDAVPKSTDPTAVRIAPAIVTPASPVPTRPNYLAVADSARAQGVTISGTGASTNPSSSRIRKALPQSYLDATGARPDGNTTTTDEFGCEIRGQPTFPAGHKVSAIGWGPMISYALRQPRLATALGLRYELLITVPSSATLGAGGWLFIELDAGDPWAQAATPGQIRLYAARLPALAARRQVFAAITFPVDATAAIDDHAFTVAEAYDDGFAQIVHLYQPQANDAVIGDGTLPAASDIGIQIGWDDEQVVAWQNAQIDMLNARLAGGLDAQTPLGVLGYRVDVADVTERPPAPTWVSLVRADVVLPQGFGRYNGELFVEPTALRPQDPASPGSVSGDAWLPRYFANWRGGSLVKADAVPRALLDGKSVEPQPDPVGVLLSYGHSYAFRTRLADLSSGGPAVGDGPVNLHPADVATLDFRRAVPPKQPIVQRSVPAGASIPEALTFFRPLIGYPEVLYTGLGNSDADRQQIVGYLTQNSQPGSGVVVGLPDPDVETLDLVVEVRTPLHDVAGDGALDAPFRELYRTTRPFPSLPAGPLPADPGLRLDLAYVDAPSVLDWTTAQPATGPLVIPRARDVRITARAHTRDDPTYFSPTAAIGLPASLIVRAELHVEPALLIAPADGSPPLRAFLFKRPPGISAPPVAAQLAQELGVAVSGLTLSAPPGSRVAFGASKAVRHSLPGDNATISFASESELSRQWIVALVVDLDRDWTWDGLANANAIAVERDGATVGSLTVARTLGAAAVADPPHWERHRTRLIFFDGVDPHESTASAFPEAIAHTWKIVASSVMEISTPVGVSGTPALQAGTITPRAEPDLNGESQSLTLPIAVPPAQIPEIASVGLALSPFAAGPGYATTAARQRALWIELNAPIQNETGDALFARVAGHGADPLLYSAIPSTDQADEPPLALDPELMRVITPGESDDRAGLDALTMLEHATGSKVHFLLPLPPGIDPLDPELFGFYTYELRVGHAGDPHDHRWWSTAQGRFGRPLRVNGVQHPAPTLACRAGRDQKYVVATATYATPVLNRRPLVSPADRPKTTLYFFLYAQVVQADAASNRNVLLLQRAGHFVARDQAKGGLLLSESGAPSSLSSQRDRLGYAVFGQDEIEQALGLLGLPGDLPLSVLAVELLPGGVGGDLPNPDHVAGDYRLFASAAPAAATTPAATQGMDLRLSAREVVVPPGGIDGVHVAPERPAGAPMSGEAGQTKGAVATTVVQDLDPLHLSGRPRRILRVSPLVQVTTIC